MLMEEQLRTEALPVSPYLQLTLNWNCEAFQGGQPGTSAIPLAFPPAHKMPI